MSPEETLRTFLNQETMIIRSVLFRILLAAPVILATGCGNEPDTAPGAGVIDWPEEYKSISFEMDSPNVIEVEFDAKCDWVAEIVDADGAESKSRASSRSPIEVFPKSGQAGKNFIRIEIRTIYLPHGTGYYYKIIDLIKLAGGKVGDTVFKIPVKIALRKRIACITMTEALPGSSETFDSWTMVYDDTTDGRLTAIKTRWGQCDFEYSATKLRAHLFEDYKDVMGNKYDYFMEGVITDGRLTSLNGQREEISYEGDYISQLIYKYQYSVPFIGHDGYLASMIINDDDLYGVNTLDFTWIGDNIKKIDCGEEDSDPFDEFPIRFEYTNTNLSNNLNLDLWAFIASWSINLDTVPNFIGCCGFRSRYLPTAIENPWRRIEYSYKRDAAGYITRITTNTYFIIDISYES